MAALLATTLLACGSGGAAKPKESATKAANTTSTMSKNCRPVPPPAAQQIACVPADLPLPDRTYTVSEQGTSSDGVHHGVFALPITIREFVRFAVTQWPEKGWRLGRGDSEANEAEDEFVRGQQSGSFKVRSDYCDQGWSELNLFYKAGLQ
ncbi:MAG: hypothetical protein JO148_02645 [Acidimicrobiia bacterium]|nr:hypothetical protein [Acidimicrobiia bacterium]